MLLLNFFSHKTFPVKQVSARNVQFSSMKCMSPTESMRVHIVVQ